MKNNVVFLALGHYGSPLDQDGTMKATVPCWGATLQSAVKEACKRKKVEAFELAALRKELQDRIWGDDLHGLTLAEFIRDYRWCCRDIARIPGLNYIGSYVAFPARELAHKIDEAVQAAGLPAIDPTLIPETTPDVSVRGRVSQPLDKGERIFSPEGLLVYGPKVPDWTRANFAFPALKAKI